MKYQIHYQNKTASIRTENTHIAKSYRIGKFYEQEFLEDIKNTSGTFIDVGAHVGNHTIFLGLFSKFDKIIAIEPCREHYLNLIRNITDNSIQDKVTTFNLAISNRMRRLSINRSGPNDGSYSVREGNDIYGIPLDSLRIVPAAIKLDIEGHEPEALVGAIETIKKYGPILYIELNQNVPIIKKYLSEIGYRLTKVYRMGSELGRFEWQE